MRVLILIVVEDGLVHNVIEGESIPERFVLILIVVEDGLVPKKALLCNHNWIGVLILIVVEDGLVLGYEDHEEEYKEMS